jgi:aromatic-L-amino-acid decarboxylase
VQAQVAPGEVAGKLPPNAPEEAEPFSRLVADLESIVVPGVTQVQHPRYFGWFPANATLSSALGDLASAGIGALGITWQSAPALTEVEEVVVEWLRELTGLPDSWKGVIQDTASTACLVALLVARERATDYSEVRGGLQAESAPLTVYTTEHAHSSVVKAVALAGFGRDNLRLVGVDPVTYAMRPDELARAPEEDIKAGRRPAAVVVSVGTTGTTAVDPLARLSRWPSATGCGCTSTRPWRARRCCCRKCAGWSTASKARTRCAGTRTSGGGPCSTARCCTSPTPPT